MNKESLIQLRKTIAKTLFKFSEKQLENGTVIVYETEKIVEGAELKTYDANGGLIPLPNGVYDVDGVKVKVEDGIVNSIEKPIENAEEVDKEVEKTDEVEKTEEPITEDQKDIAEDIVENIVPKDSPDYELIINDLVEIIKSLQKDISSLQLDLIEQKTNLTKLSKTPLALSATEEIEIVKTNKEKESNAIKIAKNFRK